MGKRVLTNKFNLPQVLVNAVSVDKHITAGDISVTGLIDAPQIRYLKKHNDYEEDVMDMIWALMGTAVHHVLERAESSSSDAQKLISAAGVLNEQSREKSDESLSKASEYLKKKASELFPGHANDDVITEQTLSVTIDGMTISGTFDRLVKSEKLLQDYKNCSVYQYIYPESRKKWAAQVNLYRYLIFKQLGILVEKAQIIAIFRDWSEARGKSNKDYPDNPIKIIDIPLFPIEKVEAYLKGRIYLHKRADNGDVEPCSGEDRWATSDRFAVMPAGGKKALRVLDTEAAAKDFLDKEGHRYKGAVIELRPGESKRCDSYCPVANVCPQYKAMKEKINSVSLVEDDLI